MPVKSQAQAKYLGIHHPEILRRWKKEGYTVNMGSLPKRVGGKKTRQR